MSSAMGGPCCCWIKPSRFRDLTLLFTWSGFTLARSAVGRLRVIALYEGISLLLLMGIGMPLKYLAGQPMGVRILGWVHGVLFVIFCLALLRAARERRWGLRRMATVFIAGFLPTGSFWVDPSLKREELSLTDEPTGT